MAISITPISPVALEILGLEIRWYALAYIISFILGYWFMRKLYMGGRLHTKKNWDDLLAAVIIGTIIGGRLGYVLFYNLSYFLAHPLEIFAVWNGGMAFHGGLLGVIAGVFFFSKWRIKDAFGILDLMAVVTPIGLFFGRIANFINMEVMGRATDGPLGIVFVDRAGMPLGDGIPRHASPLYEAALEGILLFIIMFILWKFTKLRNHTGMLSGIFAITYALFRIVAEQFRQPDAQIGFLTDWGLTMGALLSGVMLTAGIIAIVISLRKGSTCRE
ncbi:MAG: prolipoprotein diacylglyceryl transferase [Alphaproteobacteria bacterium]|nr:prolipoprotein diacylglyceryl transferase [Alphaproteobacteria bacterium]